MLFRSVSVENYPLAILAMVAAVVAAYLYLRIIVSMWLQTSDINVRISTSTQVVVGVAIAAVIAIGVLPYQVLLRFVNQI